MSGQPEYKTVPTGELLENMVATMPHLSNSLGYNRLLRNLANRLTRTSSHGIGGWDEERLATEIGVVIAGLLYFLQGIDMWTPERGFVVKNPLWQEGNDV